VWVLPFYVNTETLKRDLKIQGFNIQRFGLDVLAEGHKRKASRKQGYEKFFVCFESEVHLFDSMIQRYKNSRI